MHFVDSGAMLFRGSHIGFSLGIMLLSVCFICSLSQVRRAPLSLITPHYILHLAQNSYGSITDAGGRLKFYLQWYYLFDPHHRQAALGSWAKGVKAVITTTRNDNLPAVLRTYSLPHVWRIAVTAFSFSTLAALPCSDSFNKIKRKVNHYFCLRLCRVSGWPLYEILGFIFLWRINLTLMPQGWIPPLPTPSAHIMLRQNCLLS